ncbi:MAG: DUF3089 domain-containing protein [Gammaproteobacteria bacterium]|nr:MAG: DUF3089 domain-containing protein [Gammaproteobacteria bacterium]
MTERDARPPYRLHASTPCAIMILLGCLALPAAASDGAAANDYADPATWLCLPGRDDDACATDLSTTVIHADGRTELETFEADPDAPIDCFYVYPTVSTDPTPNADMHAGTEEHAVIAAQFARFGSQCRTYAPLYRQVTLTALRSLIAGEPMQPDRVLAYQDVVDAWNHYLTQHNDGRGVVLIGHSQGAGMLTQLLRNEIENGPAADRIVSALIIGSNFMVPKEKTVGGALSHMPLCKRAEQTGCVITFVSFREELPPPEHSRFGRGTGDGMEAACVNPAALRGNASLDAYLSAAGTGIAEGNEGEAPTWLRSGESINTPFVRVPDMLEAECVRDRGFHYLSVRSVGEADGARSDRIGGDVVGPGGEVAADWGLHLIDVHLAKGDLIAIVGRQAEAWLAR